MTLERRLREKSCLQRQRRLMREAYEPVWKRIRTQMPVVFALEGNLHAFPLQGEETLSRLRESGAVFALESAARTRYGCKLLNTDDVFAYVEAVPDLGDPLPGVRLSLDPLRSACAFVVVRVTLPPFETLADGTRVVLPDRLLMEYVGLVGHRFDLLAALCACLDRPSAR